jgi:hypothetical protein
MATTSTQPKRSRSASALEDSYRPAHSTRQSTMPAYYLGRPAWMWMALFHRTRSHA